MKILSRLALCAVSCVVSLLPAPSVAAFIDGAVSGPGGTGSSGVFLGSGSNLAEPALTYTSVNYLDLSLTVDVGGAYEVAETPAFGSVHNFSGQAWSGFTWEVISGPAVSFIYNPAAFSGLDFANKFPSVTGTPTFATFSGGVLADGAYFLPDFKMTIDGPGTIVIRQTPIPVPEPASLVLLIVGGVGISYRWTRKRARAV